MVRNDRRGPLGWLGMLAIAALAAAPAHAELTVKDLTGTAMPRVGPFFQDVSDALRAFAARDFKTALGRLQNAKKLTPALAPAELMMARMYFDAGSAPGGNAMLETAIRAAPQDPEAYLMLAERALAEGRFSEAELMVPKVEKLVEAFNQNPRRRQDLRLRAYTVGAAVDQARGNLDAAKTKLESLVRLDPQNASAHERLGQLLFAQNDQRAAYEAFKLAAQADEKALPADLMMAKLSVDKLKAQQWLDRAIKLNPDDLRTHVSAADYLLTSNQVEQATAHAEKAIALDPDGFESNLVAGLLARMDGQFAKAATHLSKAHLLQPANLDVMRHLALVLSELPDNVSRLRGLQFGELAVRQNPEHPDYLAALGWINYRLDRKAAAERYLAAALNSKSIQSSKNLNSELRYFLAHVAQDRGNPTEAIKLLRDALDTEQPFAYRKAAESMLARLAKSSGDPSDARPRSTDTPQPGR